MERQQQQKINDNLWQDWKKSTDRYSSKMGFPYGSASEEFACSAEDTGDVG